MMTDEQIALARRAVACKGWRWMPGMRWTNDPAKPLTSDGDEGRYEYGYTPPKYGVPVLEDPATLGCLLALVREAWWQDDMGASRYKDQWSAEVTPQEAPNYAFYAFYGASEAEALVAALEAAQ